MCVRPQSSLVLFRSSSLHLHQPDFHCCTDNAYVSATEMIFGIFMLLPLVQICIWLDKYTFCNIAVFPVKVIIENFGSFYQLLLSGGVTLISCQL